MKTLEKVEKLREMISKYDTENFCGFFAYFIKNRPPVQVNISLNKFDSKLKDFLYLISLKVFSNAQDGVLVFERDDTVIGELADLLNDIKNDYYVNDFENYNLNALLHEVAFRNYFDNGTLSYVEQDLERLRLFFGEHNLMLESEFGFDANFVIEAYKASEHISRIRYELLAGFMVREEYFRFAQDVSSGKVPFDVGFSLLPEDIQNSYLNFYGNEYKYLIFSAEDFYYLFPKDKVDRFLHVFSCKIEPNIEFNYYTDTNPLELAPFIKLNNGLYLNIYQKQIPIAAVKVFTNFLARDKERYSKFKKQKEKKIEVKAIDIFKRFFNEKNTFFYQNYNLQKNTEQDLLIISRGAVIIVEVKASRLREPFRDIAKAVERIKSDFKECVQYGYDQCRRVENTLYENKVVNIRDEKGNILYSLNTNKINSIFSIIVTLERFGPLQTNLDMLLEKDIGAINPWSVYIDDLETFFIGLKAAMKNPQAKFIDFLRHRHFFHGRVYAIDELDICGRFLSNQKEFTRISKIMDTFITFSPKDLQVFDHLYHAGRLKFNERIDLTYLNYSNSNVQ